MKFEFYNDTGREIRIHPATEDYGVKCDMSPIQHLELRVFEIPEGKTPFVKLWDYQSFNEDSEAGLQILVITSFSN